MLIYCVVKYGYIEIVKYLLFKGVDRIIVDKYKCFLVVMVERMNYMDIVKIFCLKYKYFNVN